MCIFIKKDQLSQILYWFLFRLSLIQSNGTRTDKSITRNFHCVSMLSDSVDYYYKMDWIWFLFLISIQGHWQNRQWWKRSLKTNSFSVFNRLVKCVANVCKDLLCFSALPDHFTTETPRYTKPTILCWCSWKKIKYPCI